MIHPITLVIYTHWFIDIADTPRPVNAALDPFLGNCLAEPTKKAAIPTTVEAL